MAIGGLILEVGYREMEKGFLISKTASKGTNESGSHDAIKGTNAELAARMSRLKGQEGNLGVQQVRLENPSLESGMIDNNLVGSKQDLVEPVSLGNIQKATTSFGELSTPSMMSPSSVSLNVDDEP